MIKGLMTREQLPGSDRGVPHQLATPGAAIDALVAGATGDRAELARRGEALGAMLARGEALSEDEAGELRKLVVIGLVTEKQLQAQARIVAEARANARTLARFTRKVQPYVGGTRPISEQVKAIEARLAASRAELLKVSSLSSSLALGTSELQALIGSNEGLWPAGTRAQQLIDEALRELEAGT